MGVFSTFLGNIFLLLTKPLFCNNPNFLLYLLKSMKHQCWPRPISSIFFAKRRNWSNWIGHLVAPWPLLIRLIFCRGGYESGLYGKVATITFLSISLGSQRKLAVDHWVNRRCSLYLFDGRSAAANLIRSKHQERSISVASTCPLWHNYDMPYPRHYNAHILLFFMKWLFAAHFIPKTVPKVNFCL